MIDTTGIPAIDLESNGLYGERYVLQVEEELRCEINFSSSSTIGNKKPIVYITLQKGSCEVFGIELPLNKTLVIGGSNDDINYGIQLAFYTWYGAVIDITSNSDTVIEMPYTSDETSCNIAYVNTHAQLEVLRDDAVLALSNPTTIDGGVNSMNSNNSNNSKIGGPRVLICGPKECGKSTLVRILTAYACKLGRTPIVVDLDPADNGISIPGTLCACPYDISSLTIDMYLQNTMSPTPPIIHNHSNNSTSTSSSSIATPLTVWHGSTIIQDELYKEQTIALAEKINQRFNNGDDWGNSSGIIINTSSTIQEEKQYTLLLHTIQTFNINIILVLGHDRLYSMLRNSTIVKDNTVPIKVIKVPRSGGVVSRDAQFMRQRRSRSIKRYFYGPTIDNKVVGSDSTTATANATSSSSSLSSVLKLERILQLTPFLLQISYNKLKFYKLVSISLSASLLPVAQEQSTEHIQLHEISNIQEFEKKYQHSLVAVCHNYAVQQYERSNISKDLYTNGIAGFISIERIIVDTEMIHLLLPCANSTLPSTTLLVGDNISWMD